MCKQWLSGKEHANQKLFRSSTLNSRYYVSQLTIWYISYWILSPTHNPTRLLWIQEENLNGNPSFTRWDISQGRSTEWPAFDSTRVNFLANRTIHIHPLRSRTVSTEVHGNSSGIWCIVSVPSVPPAKLPHKSPDPKSSSQKKQGLHQRGGVKILHFGMDGYWNVWTGLFIFHESINNRFMKNKCFKYTHVHMQINYISACLPSSTHHWGFDLHHPRLTRGVSSGSAHTKQLFNRSVS